MCPGPRDTSWSARRPGRGYGSERAPSDCMKRPSEPPVRSFGVQHLVAILFFFYAANQIYSHGPRPLNWLGFVLEGFGFLLLARTGQTALRDVWRLPPGRAGVLLIVAGVVLTPFAFH